MQKNLREEQDLEEKAERAFYESLFKEKARQRREEEIKANVYADLLDQALEAILNKDYRGKDSLVANLDFSEDNYGAQTYFTDIGLEKKCAMKISSPGLKMIMKILNLKMGRTYKMNLKKILAVILSISCMFSFIFPLQVFAEDYCDSNRNSKGGYIDESCADFELEKVRNNQVDYASVENLGFFGDEERYCFNFRALDDVYEEKKLVSVADLRKERNALSKVYYPSFFNLNKILAIGLTSLVGSLMGYFFQNIRSCGTESKGSILSNQGNGQLNSGSASDYDKTPTPTPTTRKPGHSIFLACIGALILPLASSICLYANYDAQKNTFERDRKTKLRELNNKIVEINRLNKHKSTMLNLLLKSLENSRIMSNVDMFCFYDRLDDTHCTPFDYDAKYAGINYTKAELESFPKKFKEIAAKIRKKLEETGYLDSDNEISGKAANLEQRELSD